MLLALSLLLFAGHGHAYNYTIPTGNGDYGIDISHYTNVTSWSRLMAQTAFPIKFIITKATEGATYVDPTLDAYWANMTALRDTTVGVYHFYRSDVSVEDNYRNVESNILKRLSFNKTKHLLAIDVETNYSNVSKSVFAHDLDQFLKLLKAKHDIVPMLYTGAWFWDKHLAEEADAYGFEQYPLWVSTYGPAAPIMPRSWKTYKIWQYTSIERLDGIAGNVDMNWWPH